MTREEELLRAKQDFRRGSTPEEKAKALVKYLNKYVKPIAEEKQSIRTPIFDGKLVLPVSGRVPSNSN